jgi:hypothetical protein
MAVDYTHIYKPIIENTTSPALRSQKMPQTLIANEAPNPKSSEIVLKVSHCAISSRTFRYKKSGFLMLRTMIQWWQQCAVKGNFLMQNNSANNLSMNLFISNLSHMLTGSILELFLMLVWLGTCPTVSMKHLCAGSLFLCNCSHILYRNGSPHDHNNKWQNRNAGGWRDNANYSELKKLLEKYEEAETEREVETCTKSHVKKALTALGLCLTLQ